MKNIFTLIVFILTSLTVSAQDITEGLWKIKNNSVLMGADTIYLFQENQSDNTFDFSGITYDFDINGTYSGLSIDGTSFSGNWLLNSGEFTMDDNKADFEFINNSEFILKSNFGFLDTTGTLLELESILTFYNSETVNLIEDFFEERVEIYPVPFDDFFEVKLKSENISEVRIELMDLFGRIIFVKEISNLKGIGNKIIVETSDISSGSYFLVIKYRNGISFKKVVKI